MTNREKCKQAFGALHAKEDIFVSDKVIDLSCYSHKSGKQIVYVAIVVAVCVCVVTNILYKNMLDYINISNQEVSGGSDTDELLSVAIDKTDNIFDDIESKGTVITPLEIIMDSSQLYLKLKIRAGNDVQLDRYTQYANHLQLIDDKTTIGENCDVGNSDNCERIQLRDSYDMIEFAEDNTIIYTAYFWNYTQNSQSDKLHFDRIGIIEDGKMIEEILSGNFDIPLEQGVKSTKKSIHLEDKYTNLICTNLACYMEYDSEFNEEFPENGEITYEQIGTIEAVMVDGDKVEYDWKYGIWEKPIDIEDIKLILIDGKEQKIWEK